MLVAILSCKEVLHRLRMIVVLTTRIYFDGLKIVARVFNLSQTRKNQVLFLFSCFKKLKS